MEITLTIIGIVISTIVAILVGRWQNKSSKRIAKETGAYDKGLLVFEFLGRKLADIGFNQIIFGCNFSNIEHCIFDFPISVRNRGTKSIENLYLVFKYPGKSPITIDDKASTKFYSPFLDDYIVRKYTETPNEKYVTFFIKQINPQVGIDLVDLLKLRETTIYLDFQSRTKDDVLVNVKATIPFEFHYSMSYTANNIPSGDFRFIIRAYNSKNIEDLVNIVNTSATDKEEGVEMEFAEKVSQGVKGLNPGIIINSNHILNQKLTLLYPDFTKNVDNNNEGKTFYTGKVNGRNVRYMEFASDIKWKGKFNATRAKK